jgi:hypothetical protein
MIGLKNNFSNQGTQMRLNRENTLIGNNLCPCTGLTDSNIQKKFVQVLTPNEYIFYNIEKALFLENIPLY